jgi:hypothetical protein
MNEQIIAARNQYTVKGNVGKLTVVRRDGTPVVVTFDAADFQRLNREVWRINSARGGYFYGFNTEGEALAHFILKTDPTKTQISYQNGDTLDVRRSNLVTMKRGKKLTLKPDGSCYISRQQDGYRAYLFDDGRKVYLGRFQDRDKALNAWKIADDQRIAKAKRGKK